jgi:hypothetical protein
VVGVALGAVLTSGVGLAIGLATGVGLGLGLGEALGEGLALGLGLGVGVGLTAGLTTDLYTTLTLHPCCLKLCSTFAALDESVTTVLVILLFTRQLTDTFSLFLVTVLSLIVVLPVAKTEPAKARPTTNADAAPKSFFIFFTSLQLFDPCSIIIELKGS